MPLDVQTNRRLLDRVRASWLLPRPPPLELIEPPETTPEDRRRLLDRLTKGRPSEREQREDRTRVPPQVAASTHTFDIEASTVAPDSGLLSGSAAGPIPFPYIIEQVIISVANKAAALGNSSDNFSTLLISTNAEISRAAFEADENLNEGGGDTFEGIKFFTHPTTTGTILGVHIATRRLVTTFPTFLKHVNIADIDLFNPHITVTIREIGPEIRAAALPVFIPRIGAPPPPPRTPSQPTPRAVTVRVLQGGRILSERLIPWAFLDPSLKSQVIANILQGRSDPTLEPMF